MQGALLSVGGWNPTHPLPHLNENRYKAVNLARLDFSLLTMKTQTILLAVATAISAFSLNLAAKADTVNAHCDVYPLGQDHASSSSSCTFSQRQGFISIETQDGVRYELSPVGDQPGNFVDAAGNAVYRQAGLGDAGQIFRMRNESIYVYWDSAPFSGDHTTPYSNAERRIGTLRASEPGSQINVRDNATLYSRAIAYGLPGDRINILECQQDTDTAGSDLNWCRVQFVESGAIGWIRSDFIIFPSDGV